MKYDEVIKDLTSQGKFKINLGLERIASLMELLDNPQDKIKCIQVAGTNGKGSVCTSIASILSHSGYKIGLYTSPHIFDYTERIKMGDDCISESDFIEYYELIIKIAEKNEIYPTEFEILTAMMYKYFYDKGVDIAIIETGLGGRFDATNIIKSNLCAVITHIDLDHTERLGDTKSKIAFEKSGIIKPNSVVITSQKYEVIKNRADELNSRLLYVNKSIDFKYKKEFVLKGEHQIENLALVVTVIKTIFPSINSEIILKGLKNVKNPCRFQYIKEKNLIIDGAHNPNCFQALMLSLDEYFPNVKRNYIFGCLKTKDYKNMVKYLISDKNLNKLYIYSFNNPNACTFDDISKVSSVKCESLYSKDEINEIAKNYLTVICGSFYMINELVDKEVIFKLS